jgi:predicted nuclease of restriction endonuclease-like (RecB) superfamily
MEYNIQISDKELISNIKEILERAKKNIAKNINTEMLFAYWKIGELIVNHEHGGKVSAEYGKQFLRNLSKSLSNELGKGFSISNLQFMRRFYLNYPNQQTLSVNLSWSHYCELLTVPDVKARSFYEKETINSNWSLRELRRQIETSLFERLILSSGDNNKKKLLELAQKGQTIQKPEDLLKDPYVLEFVGLPENKPMLEKDLERALINRIEKFLLELGRGFMFVGSQQKLTIGNTHYYVDLVFYNKLLRAYVLIDLKIGSLKPENVGQMNAYLNYYATEVNDKGDAKPIGIILCANTSQIVAEYALGGLENQVFASKYTLYIPDKDSLIKQVEEVVKENQNLIDKGNS